MIHGTIELVVDPVDEKIEELSAVTAAWQKNRDRNRPSPSLRAAIIMVAQDLLTTDQRETVSMRWLWRIGNQTTKEKQNGK